jgi:hexosaminidase
VGRRLYAPLTVAGSFDWDPIGTLPVGQVGQVAGVEAAIWCETITNFDDLTFLLLPRLAGVANKSWSEPLATTWTDHRDRVARHGRMWTQDDLTYFRASSVEWL